MFDVLHISDVNTRTRRAPAAAAAPELKRFSCGALWGSKNPDFMSGNLQEASGRYMNQQPLLDILPEPPEGHCWRLKAFAKEVTSAKSPLWDIVLELEPIYQR